MEYRGYGRGTERFSTLGLGGERLIGMPETEVHAFFDAAMNAGINILDIYMPDPDVRTHIGRALLGRREQMYIQGHLGSTWQNGQYTRTRDLKQVEAAFADLLTRLQTDYIDFGMIHYVDTEEDCARVLAPGGMLDYAVGLREQGRIRHIGLSSHNPVVAKRLVETGEIDLLLFSINPAYDMDEPGNDNIDALMGFQAFEKRSVGIEPVRTQLYALCARMGVAITVMKALGAGTLLRAESSPFGQALTVPQCLQYTLDRPAVVSNLIGFHSVEELQDALAFYVQPEADKDYTPVITGKKLRMEGRCMYCGHCLPCPKRIDIAAVNKFIDLAKTDPVIPETVREHYTSLEHHAGDCIGCGSCEKNCPFGVPVRARMQEAV